MNEAGTRRNGRGWQFTNPSPFDRRRNLDKPRRTQTSRKVANGTSPFSLIKVDKGCFEHNVEAKPADFDFPALHFLPFFLRVLRVLCGLFLFIPAPPSRLIKVDQGCLGPALPGGRAFLGRFSPFSVLSVASCKIQAPARCS